MKTTSILFGLILILFSCTENESTTDVIIYGGTSSAIIAAVEVAKSGKTVVLVSPDKHLGGLTAGGLGWTDSGNKKYNRRIVERFLPSYLGKIPG